MVGQVIPQPLHTSYRQELAEPALAQSRRWSSLAVFAALAVATAFAMLLLTATVFDVGAQSCDQSVDAEACCLASSADSFAADACRALP